MLDKLLGGNEIEGTQPLAQSARDAGVDKNADLTQVNQRLRAHCTVDLADAAHGQRDVMAGQLPARNRPARGLQVRQTVGQTAAEQLRLDVHCTQNSDFLHMCYPSYPFRRCSSRITS